MSVVIFPFKGEDPAVLLRNVRIAATHPRVRHVVCVGAEEDECFRAVSTAAPRIAKETGCSVEVILQERIGSKRPGKGDGMNTGLRYFLEKTDEERVHFYDADILSFSHEWITKAENAADAGYAVVRHYFPRASTDGMITWFITRTGFAILWPRSELPRIQQPLGGELLLTRPVAGMLAVNPRVQAQSDWGIDTLYTFFTVAAGVSLYEVYIGVGKLHKLYNTLADLRTMLIECFSALQSLAGEQVLASAIHHIEPPGPVSDTIKAKIGYSFDGTLALLAQGWTERQFTLLERFPRPVREGMICCSTFPRVQFMDSETWYESYLVLLREFRPDDPDWQELLFKLWITRVLAYTVTQALRGHDSAMHYLHSMIEDYIWRALRRS